MSSDSTALRHNALVYESKDEYLARAVPFLKAGIEAGEGAVVAHTKPGLAMMREALGPEAAHVTFVDVSAAYTRPARVLCSYDANGTPDPIIEGVWQTHPEVVDDDSWSSSDQYEDPDHLLRR